MLISGTWTGSDNLALHRFFLGGVGDDDTAYSLLFGTEAANHHPIVQRAKFHGILTRACPHLGGAAKTLGELTDASYGIRDDQWERIRDLLPLVRRDIVGVTAADNRLFVEAVLYRYRTGMPWRDLPERFGDWKNVHQRFSRWAKSGVWEKVFLQLSADADNEYAIDRQHHCACPSAQRWRPKKAGEDQAIGRSRGGLSTKIHALVDALGNPCQLLPDSAERRMIWSAPTTSCPRCKPTR